MVTTNQKTQLAEKLSILREDITSLDRKAACDQLSLSRPTLSNYLNGKVRDNDLAASLIKFFKERIKERNAVLA